MSTLNKEKFKGFNIEYFGASNPYCYLLLKGSTDITPFTSDNSNYLLNTIAVNYFQEHFISQHSSIILKGGTHYTPLKTMVFSAVNDGNGFIRFQYTDHFGILLSAEPRYYFRRLKDDINSSIYNFNCGFVSFPLDYVTYSNFYGAHLIKLYFSPQLGFRQPISNHIFAEGMLGCRITGTFNTEGSLFKPYFLPTASLKLCYMLY